MAAGGDDHTDGMTGGPLPEPVAFTLVSPGTQVVWQLSWLFGLLQSVSTNRLDVPENHGGLLLSQHLQLFINKKGPVQMDPDGNPVLIPFGPAGMNLDQWWKEVSSGIPRHLCSIGPWRSWPAGVPLWLDMRRLLDSWHIKPAMSPFPKDSPHHEGVDPDLWQLLHVEENGPFYSPYLYYVLLPQLGLGLEGNLSEAEWWNQLMANPDKYNQLRNYASDLTNSM